MVSIEQSGMVLSIVVLSYNSKNLTVKCIDSLLEYYKKQFEDKSFELIVVDNASSDDSPQELMKFKAKIPCFRFIQNAENMGFAKGCNLAVTHAKGEYILFLNSDTELQDTMLEEAIKKLESNERIAVVGGLLQNQKKTTSHSYGYFLTPFMTFAMLFGLARIFNKQQTQQEEVVDWVSGGCMLVKRSLFEKINGFDEHFFMYIEDMELCYRIKHLGYSIIYYPRFAVIHRAQGSSNRSFATIQIYKGILYFYKKHKPQWEGLLVKLLLILKAILVIIIGTITFNNKMANTYRKAISLTL